MLGFIHKHMRGVVLVDIFHISCQDCQSYLGHKELGDHARYRGGQSIKRQANDDDFTLFNQLTHVEAGRVKRKRSSAAKSR